MAQNVAKPIFLSKSIRNLHRGKSSPKSYFFKFQKMPELKNGPICQNSPNLVTLTAPANEKKKLSIV
jgi:hypothetical protein